MCRNDFTCSLVNVFLAFSGFLGGVNCIEKITQLTFGICIVLCVAKHESWKWMEEMSLWFELLNEFVYDVCFWINERIYKCGKWNLRCSESWLFWSHTLPFAKEKKMKQNGCEKSTNKTNMRKKRPIGTNENGHHTIISKLWKKGRKNKTKRVWWSGTILGEEKRRSQVCRSSFFAGCLPIQFNTYAPGPSHLHSCRPCSSWTETASRRRNSSFCDRASKPKKKQFFVYVSTSQTIQSSYLLHISPGVSLELDASITRSLLPFPSSLWGDNSDALFLIVTNHTSCLPPFIVRSVRYMQYITMPER